LLRFLQDFSAAESRIEKGHKVLKSGVEGCHNFDKDTRLVEYHLGKILTANIER